MQNMKPVHTCTGFVCCIFSRLCAFKFKTYSNDKPIDKLVKVAIPLTTAGIRSKSLTTVIELSVLN